MIPGKLTPDELRALGVPDPNPPRDAEAEAAQFAAMLTRLGDLQRQITELTDAPPPPLTFDLLNKTMSELAAASIRERLGRLVRETWVTYCREIGDTKPAHLAPWEELSESDQEVDRRIGVAVATATIMHLLHG